MTDITGRHAPSAEFRARLEQDVVRASLRETRFHVDRGFMTRRRMRAFSLVFAGLVLGLTTEFASGQVQEGRERSRLVEAYEANRQMAALRLQLEEEELALVRSRHEIGVETRDALAASEARVREMRYRVVRIDLELAEVRASAAPARDELWAPLVSGRDFVSDRLKVDAAGVQERLRAAESTLEERERAHRVGSATTAAVEEARSRMEYVRGELEVLAMKLNLRKQYLEQHLAAEDVEWRLKAFLLQSDMRRLTRAMQHAEERLRLTRDEARVGAVTQLEVKRAEVSLLELQASLRQVQLQLREVEAMRRKGGPDVPG
jgi:hypothetical protein